MQRIDKLRECESGKVVVLCTWTAKISSSNQHWSFEESDTRPKNKFMLHINYINYTKRELFVALMARCCYCRGAATVGGGGGGGGG